MGAISLTCSAVNQPVALTTKHPDIAGAAGHQGLNAMSRAAVEVTRLTHERSDMDPATLAEMILSLRQVSLDALSAYCQSELQN